MADPRLILGRIVSVAGPEVGPSTQISYTIAVHDPVVDGVYRLNQQRPVSRWPDEIDIRASPPGMIVIGTVSANRVQWHFHEYPAFGACRSNASDYTLPPDQSQEQFRRPPDGGQPIVEQAAIPDINPN